MAIGLPLSHLEIQASDDSWLLLVDGRPVDVAGYFAEKRTQLTRNCSPVKDLSAADRLHAEALRAVRHYSPPDSLSAQLVHAIRQDKWLLVQVQFSDLQAAVVMLTDSGQGLTIPEGAVWSGSTHPHRPDPFIRRYLRSRVPTAPADLIACFESRI
jgi:hypothetical protein